MCSSINSPEFGHTVVQTTTILKIPHTSSSSHSTFPYIPKSIWAASSSSTSSKRERWVQCSTPISWPSPRSSPYVYFLSSSYYWILLIFWALFSFWLIFFFFSFLILFQVGYQLLFFIITALLKFDKVTDFAGDCLDLLWAYWWLLDYFLNFFGPKFVRFSCLNWRIICVILILNTL